MQVEYIVVGQGLSGSWVSWFLWQQNKSFVVIDKEANNTASRNSAGIMNPTSGKRYAKVPMMDELFSFAKKSYQEVEKKFNKKLINDTAIIDFFQTVESEELFLKRLNEESELLKIISENQFIEKFTFENKIGKIEPCYRVDVTMFLDLIKLELKHQNQFFKEQFEYEKVRVESNKIYYKEFDADKIIFCDGVSVSQNSFFKNEEFANTIGELFLVEINNLSDEFIYKNKHLIVLFKDNLYWVGASNSWKYENEIPTQEFYSSTQNWLNDFLKIPYKIIEHKASLRPTTNNRNVLAKWYPPFSNVGILNGMGTKGSFQAPYYASKLLKEIL